MRQEVILQEFFRLPQPLPAVTLGTWPTRVEHLPHLTELLGAEIWIKRDDTCGSLYGGNKVRKLELLLGQAKSDGCRSVVTIGGIGSHQVVATAIYGQRLGLSTQAIVFPQPVTAGVRHNLRLAAAAGTEFIPIASANQLPEALEKACQRAEPPCFLIPAGGSSPLGNLGYVAAALELHQQITLGQFPVPDEIFLPLGSGGTMAGLVCGNSLVNSHSQIVGVRVAAEDVVNPTVVRQQIAAVAGLLRRLRADKNLPPTNHPIKILNNQFGGQYGRPTTASVGALEMAMQAEGIALETTYTAKTMAAMIEYCRGPGKGHRVLFWNTYNAQDTSWLMQGVRERPLPEEIQNWLIRDAIFLDDGSAA